MPLEVMFPDSDRLSPKRTSSSESDSYLQNVRREEFRTVLEAGPPKARAKARLAEWQAWSSGQDTMPCSTEKGSDEEGATVKEEHLHGPIQLSLSGKCKYPAADFQPLQAFQDHVASKRAGLQWGKARFAGLTTRTEYSALLRVCREQDIYSLRKKGKRPGKLTAPPNEQPGDPQRRYMLRSGGWEIALCQDIAEEVLVRRRECYTTNDTSTSQGEWQIWVHEDNVEWYLWHIHSLQLGHAGMDRTWAEVQQQLYGCTQNLCRAYVVACRCGQNKGRSKRPIPSSSSSEAAISKRRSRGSDEGEKSDLSELKLSSANISLPALPAQPLLRSGSPAEPSTTSSAAEQDQWTSQALLYRAYWHR
uniref:Uncharacterized protein n=1 Tax=Tetraselmis sp. GSL018 TaxID=582737 RepID=A0A061R136_9CHLO|mmetsp:Transcript_9574/g.23029  ORF Transcript_9574/g.23029 Transcript_9574/m.23029 type:complete len:362 (-) Transcript_9574:247-1332(-)|eukprot:CAMPEP_0177603484 /NCGR_PEP_ID=MMETSP0419_2-20121207/15541_1 /TAXON_ID=582737 /ORGANISM="Tetraselmis sp., Strain GSL018" /LENGTH=361 /DNA_ID=CAMNT_0019097267 /DNA_START=232 /DNA_END=1317 /DNA_ORIENTATION=+